MTPLISWCSGKNAIAAAVTRTATATVERMRRLTVRVTTSIISDVVGQVAPLQPSDARSPGQGQTDDSPEADQQRDRTMERCSHADPHYGLSYQPFTHSLDIRRCPLLSGYQNNRQFPVTERSVALLAPRRPKCPSSAAGSKHPRYSCASTKVLSQYRYSTAHNHSSQPLDGHSGATCQIVLYRLSSRQLSK